jgi:hypothetical protein
MDDHPHAEALAGRTEHVACIQELGQPRRHGADEQDLGHVGGHEDQDPVAAVLVEAPAPGDP